MVSHKTQSHQKILTRLAEQDAQHIHRQFPSMRAILEKDSDGGMQKIAISVFDHWLRDASEWHLMNITDSMERNRRNQSMEAHWASLFDLTPIYTPRWRGRWPGKAKLTLKRYTSRDGFLAQSRFSPSKAPTQFIILPEQGCIYAAGWDDTNVLYFQNRDNAQPVIQLAVAAGLCVLHFDET
ncbi:MAG: hypothetical protein ABN482_05000 [Corticimicrobacter sp.]|uniref:hypothetical protein n=1 Tax=Corticimicrobacter sp. TaxID=2678536 RepID=UPI0032DA31F1